jgi:hypothetical protein
MAEPVSSNTPNLVEVAAGDFLFDLKFGMQYDDRGKSRDRASHHVAIEIVARMIQAHLQRAGYVIKRQPPCVAHTAQPGYKTHLTE